MKKLLVLLLVVGVVGTVLLALKRRSDGPRPTMWEKMQERMDAMPEDFPPRVMFDNVAATRENTDRILELLEKSGDGDD